MNFETIFLCFVVCVHVCSLNKLKSMTVSRALNFDIFGCL